MSGARSRRWVPVLAGLVLLGPLACSGADVDAVSGPASESTTPGASGEGGTVTPASVDVVTDGTATSASPADDPTSTSAPTTATSAGGPDPSVPIVDPASVRDYCTIEAEVDALSAAQLGAADTRDPAQIRLALGMFLVSNEALLSRLIAAAPAAIRADVQAAYDELDAAVDDPARFDQVMTSSPASERVGAFSRANC